ncbi:MAG: alkaline phosphatase family protein [Verrucomicrobia bacterium]|nr:alkaline phosphatase family protein [Verrucomicrobiota bacterium]
MNRLAVINVVSLTEALIGEHTPRIADFVKRGALSRIAPAFPAVTCTAQSNYLTGAMPSQHGIVGNGWYNRELAEVHFWKQSNRVVRGRKIWEDLRANHPSFTVANCFWWYNMYSSVDHAITPRPMYPADGRKFFDVYSWPYAIREEIKKDLGEFPFFGFWGPVAGVKSPQGAADSATRWIGESAKWIENRYSPTLNLVYLPHLDYNLQRYGVYESSGRLNPKIFNDLLAIDVLDAGASKVFAVADHQVAHIYLNDRSLENAVREVLAKTTGVEKVLGDVEKSALDIAHDRAGDLIAIADENAWFTYYYWLDDAHAPDFARTVDIHRKPGYDPVELFIDPKIPFPKLKIAWRLLQKKLGFRMLMDVIPLDATLVKGSHGRRPADKRDWPVFITGQPELQRAGEMESTDVYHALKRHVLAQ